MKYIALLLALTSTANAAPIFNCDVILHGKPAGMLTTQRSHATFKDGKYHYLTNIDNGRTVKTQIAPDGKGSFTVYSESNQPEYSGNLDCLVMQN